MTDMLAQILLFTSLAGLCSCTIFLALVFVSALRFRMMRRRRASTLCQYPGATLLKPLCGLEPRLESNLESFFRQDYPHFEIIFGVRSEYDPSRAVVQKLSSCYPDVPVKIVVSGDPDKPNAKVCSLEKMLAVAKTDYLVISDSDVNVRANYLKDVIQPLLKPEIGLVTCLYRGVPTGGVWSRLEALGMSVEMTSGVLVADLFEGMKFALGPTMATRRDVLEAVGGIGSVAEYCADDYLLGEKVAQSGRTVVLSSHTIDHVVLNRSLRDSILHQVRWLRSTRFSRPVGHIGSALTFAMPFGVLGTVAAMALHNRILALVILAAALLNRLAISATAGWLVVGDESALRNSWLYPIRDLMGFCLWIASFFGTTIVWRNRRYRLEDEGKMVPLSTAMSSDPRAVAVDSLA